MYIPFEAKYIHIKRIKRKDKQTIFKIIEAHTSLDIKPINKGTWLQLEAVTYKKIEDNISGELAFHVTDKHLREKPYFINAKNGRVELLQITDKTSGKIWWIENKNKVSSSLFRTAGQTKLVIGPSCTCMIHIGSISFTYDELELYLKDFRSDLWGLIQKDDSYVLGEAKTQEKKVAKIEWIQKIQTFIQHTEKILKNPKKELTREYTLQKSSQVRPVPKTFMELATKGYLSKYLTGQGHKESLDVSENRYVFALVQKLITIVNHEIDTAEKRLKEFSQELKNIMKQIEKIKQEFSSNKLIIDKNHINMELLPFQEKKQDEHKTIFLKLDKQIGKSFFEGKGKLNSEDKWFTKTDNTFQFKFSNKIHPEITKLLKDKSEYEIIADYQPSTKETNTHTYTFNEISTFKLLTDFTRPLTDNEKKEFQYELKALEKNQNSLEEQLDNTKEVYDLLTPKLSQLKKIKLFFVKHKIQSKNHFTGSMTFIQNPNYQGTHQVYKQILHKSGINDDLFETIKEIEKIGILDIPKLYERWSLLQIIKVIMDRYHFIPEDKNWKEILVKQVSSSNPKNINLRFKNINLAKTINLTYEMVLENRKTPDFVLDIQDKNKINHRFIMDAKFYENLDISKVVDELYNKKDYAEGSKNSVFILHPSKQQKSYYGEKELFKWGKGSPNHVYGAVLLSPIQKEGDYLHDLQKLIGMFLQYGLEDNQNIKVANKIDSLPKEKLFCIICGGTNQKKKQLTTKGGNYKYWVTCTDCFHLTIYNYCGKCKNRLIKNGTTWTYHETHILDPINIQCPYCGDKF